MSESALTDSDMDTNSKSLAIVVCELLCYVSCKFGELSNVKLTSVLNDFYSAENITEGKEILVKAIDSLGLETWPRPRNRIKNDNKSRIEVADLLSAYAYANENLLVNKLPKFVAGNVKNLPTTRLEEGDLRCVLNKLQELDIKMDKLEKSDNVISCISNIDNKIDKLSKPMGDNMPDKPRISNPRIPGFPFGVGLTPGKTWADMASATPTIERNKSSGREAYASYMDTDTDDNGKDVGRVKLVPYKRHRSSPGQQQQQNK